MKFNSKIVLMACFLLATILFFYLDGRKNDKVSLFKNLDYGMTREQSALSLGMDKDAFKRGQLVEFSKINEISWLVTYSFEKDRLTSVNISAPDVDDNLSKTFDMLVGSGFRLVLMSKNSTTKDMVAAEKEMPRLEYNNVIENAKYRFKTTDKTIFIFVDTKSPGYRRNASNYNEIMLGLKHKLRVARIKIEGINMDVQFYVESPKDTV